MGAKAQLKKPVFGRAREVRMLIERIAVKHSITLVKSQPLVGSTSIVQRFLRELPVEAFVAAYSEVSADGPDPLNVGLQALLQQLYLQEGLRGMAKFLRARLNRRDWSEANGWLQPITNVTVGKLREGIKQLLDRLLSRASIPVNGSAAMHVIFTEIVQALQDAYPKMQFVLVLDNLQAGIESPDRTARIDSLCGLLASANWEDLSGLNLVLVWKNASSPGWEDKELFRITLAVESKPHGTTISFGPINDVQGLRQWMQQTLPWYDALPAQEQQKLLELSRGLPMVVNLLKDLPQYDPVACETTVKTAISKTFAWLFYKLEQSDALDRRVLYSVGAVPKLTSTDIAGVPGCDGEHLCRLKHFQTLDLVRNTDGRWLFAHEEMLRDDVLLPYLESSFADIDKFRFQLLAHGKRHGWNCDYLERRIYPETTLDVEDCEPRKGNTPADIEDGWGE